MTDARDLELVAACRRGDRTAFNELVITYQDRIYWVARRMLGDHDEALDITQDVFVKAWGALGEFRGDARPYTWLYRIATNLCLNRIRSRKIRNVFRLQDDEHDRPSDDPAPDETLERTELRALIARAIDRLPEKQRAVFVLRYYDELPYEEIAVIMQRSVGGLKANYFHAVRKIEEFVRNELQ